jgi:hypothetical protein
MNFKKIISLILTLALMLSFGAVNALAAPKLNTTSFTLTKGYQTTLKVSGSTAKVTWSSSDNSIATVSSAGKVVGKKVGTAVISAKVSGTTLKATAKIVATKITATKSSASINKGAYTDITLTVTGDKSGMTLSSSNSKIAKASWNGGKWNGNNITFRINGVASGTATITAYRKNYKSSYYKTITVTVPGASTSNNTSAGNTKTAINVASKTLLVDSGKTATLQVMSDKPQNLSYYSLDSTIVGITNGSVGSGYKNFTISGLRTGNSTVRIYDRTNQANYVDVEVTVRGDVYYQVSSSRPAVSNATDKIVSYAKNGSTYYMLVPYSYDSATVNTAFAKYFRSFDYYTVYNEAPTLRANGDTIRSFSPPQSYYYTDMGYRYVLIPKDYDEVKYNTAVAAYTEQYEYYTIYNARPTNLSYADTIETWKIVDSTGATVTRYVLLPAGYDANRLASLKAADLDANQTFTYYKVLTEFPVNAGGGNEIFQWYNSKDRMSKYMVVPKDNCDYVARNDAIYADTGVYCYFNAYSTQPTVQNSELERVYPVNMQSGGRTKRVYILADLTDPDYEKNINLAYSGEYFFTQQGTFYGTRPVN